MNNRKRIGQLTWSRCQTMLAGKDQRPIGYKTCLRARGVNDDVFEVVHHSTVILRFHQAGAIVARTNGWRTRTTLDRIREMSGADVYQRRHVWYVLFPSGREIEFYDGINLGKPRDQAEALEQTMLMDAAAFAALAEENVRG